MSIRFILVLIATFAAALLFLFLPALNLGGVKGLSLFAQYTAEGRIWDLFKEIGLLTFFIFVGLCVLFVLPKSSKVEPKPQVENKNRKDSAG